MRCVHYLMQKWVLEFSLGRCIERHTVAHLNAWLSGQAQPSFRNQISPQSRDDYE